MDCAAIKALTSDGHDQIEQASILALAFCISVQNAIEVLDYHLPEKMRLQVYNRVREQREMVGAKKPKQLFFDNAQTALLVKECFDSNFGSKTEILKQIQVHLTLRLGEKNFDITQISPEFLD